MRKLATVLLVLTVTLTSLPMTSPPVQAADQAVAAEIVLNELHYDPPTEGAGLEFIEVHNPTGSAVDLTGWSLASGVDFVFPRGTVLPAGGFLAVAQNPANVRAVYGGTVLGPLVGRLAREGEVVEVRDRAGNTVDRVEYGFGFPWPLAGGPAGTSIGLMNPHFDNSQPASWRAGPPTPGRANAGWTANPPPAIDMVEHTPQAPNSGSKVLIRAHVTDADGVSSVRALLQVITPGSYLRLSDSTYFTRWAPLPMQHVGGDIYQAELPANVRRHRWLIRYRVEATDLGGRSVTVPYADDTQPNFALFIYNGAPAWHGAVAPNPMGEGGAGRTYYDFNLMRPLPIYHLIADKIDVEDAQYIPDSTMTGGYMGSDYRWYGTLVVNGVVYDHVRFRARGGGYRYAVGKNHWKFNFNRGHGLQAYDDLGNPYATQWDKLNLSAVIQHAKRKFRGEQGLFETLSYKLFNLAGVPASNTNFLHFRVIDEQEESTANQYRGDFWGLYLGIENMDGKFLDEHGLPDGNLYDMHDGTGDLDNLGELGVTDGSDLLKFMLDYTFANPDEAWWRQNFDLEGYYSFRAILEAIHHYDVDQGKNYYFFNNHEAGKWQMLPWDLDLTWSETMFGEGNEPLRDRILTKPTLNLAYQNRLRELRDLLFNSEQILPMIDAAADIIDTTAGTRSMVNADRAMWDWNPILASRYVSSDRAVQGRYYTIAPNQTFRGMAELMKEYVGRRAAWIDQALLTDYAHPDTPSLTYAGPAGTPADQLTFQASAFSDPQGAGTFAAMQWRAAEIAWPGLAGYNASQGNRYEIEATWTSPVLTTSDARVTVPNGACRPGRSCRVRVRMQDNSGRWSHWSPPVQLVAGAPTLGPTADLRISEIMYHPAPSDTLPNEEMEFVELTNIGQAPIDLSNMRFSEGIEHTFPAGTSLAPGAHLVLARHARYFQARYGFAPDGTYDKSLADGGERLTLLDAYGATVLTIEYGDDDDWPEGADGDGPSLVPIALQPGLDPRAPANWRTSTLSGGSPAAADPLPIRVNEVAIDPASGQITAVELHNPTGMAIDVAGWILSDSTTALPARWNQVPSGLRMGAGSEIPAGGYLVVPLAGDNGTLPAQPEGSHLTLFSAAPGRYLSGYHHAISFAVPPANTNVARIVTSDGVEHFVPQAPTLGAANGRAQTGPVVISRVMLRPGDGVQWVELANIGVVPVPLYDTTDLRRTWVVGGVPFRLPAGITLAPGGRLIVARAEPDAFCVAASPAATVRVAGPLALPLYEQDLNLTLLQPIAWGNDSWTYAEVDALHYRAAAGWPALVDGATGLERAILDGFGGEPSTWQASTLSPAAIAEAQADGFHLCSFDVFVNAERQMEIRWSAPPAGAGARFRVLRSPLDDPGRIEEVAGTGAAAASPAGALDVYTRLDPAADPDEAYLYRLELIDAEGVAQELAMTTVRASFFAGYVPAVYR